MNTKPNTRTKTKRAPKTPRHTPGVFAGWMNAQRYSNWERSDVELFLSGGATRVTDIAFGFSNWYSRQNRADLRARAGTKNARDLVALQQRNAALHRAAQIYGVIASELLYTARTATAEQLLAEMDTPGAREIAELLQELVPEDYKD